MLKIVDMATAGVFVVMRDGRLMEFDGRSHWYALEDVRRVLKRTGQPVSDKVLTTRARSGAFGAH